MDDPSLLSLVDLVRARAEQYAPRTVYSFLDGAGAESSVTYGELDRRVRALARALRERVQPGGRVLLLYPAGLDFAIGFLGAICAGAIAVPAYPPAPWRFQTSLPRLRGILHDARPAAVLTTAAMLPVIDSMSEELPELLSMQWTATDGPAADPGAWQPPPVNAGSVAFIQYTSGTTSPPRGAVLTHANALHNLALISRCFETGPGSRAVSWLPLYHDMGLISGVLGTLYCGGSTTLMSPLDFLERPLAWLRAMARTGADIGGGPNFAYELCVERTTPEERAALDLSRWRLAFVGAEPVRARTLDRFCEAFAPSGFRREALRPCYGLAEACLLVTGARRQALPAVRAVDARLLEQGVVEPVAAGGSGARALVGCGEAPPGMDVAIVDPQTLAPCPPGRVGEIWASSRSVAGRYWGRGDSEAIGARLAGAGTGEGQGEGGGGGGFLRTGDLGFVLDGELFVTCRRKDLITLGGRHLHPQDIEVTAERAHPAVRTGGSAAFTTGGRGEEQLVVAAEVERRPGSSAPDPAEVAQAVHRAIAAEHGVPPRNVCLVAPGGIPKTSSGKVQRFAAREAYLSSALPRWEAGP